MDEQDAGVDLIYAFVVIATAALFTFVGIFRLALL